MRSTGAPINDCNMRAIETKRILRCLSQINAEAPDFTAETTQGTIDFHDWIGDCGDPFQPSEGLHAGVHHRTRLHGRLKPEFDKRNTQNHRPERRSSRQSRQMGKDIEETQGHAVNYPMIGDTDLKVAKLYDMLPAERRRPRRRAAPPRTTPRCARCSSSARTRRSRRC